MEDQQKTVDDWMRNLVKYTQGNPDCTLLIIFHHEKPQYFVDVSKKEVKYRL